MKKPAPQPRTLFDAAMQQEEARHAYRIRQLKLMQAKLAQLDEHVPAIRAAGLVLEAAEITLNPDLSLYIPRVLLGGLKQQRLLELLISRGFKEVERKDYESWFTTRISKNRLALRSSVDKPRDQAAPSAEQGATTRMTEAA